jgi:hypothetical protein
MRQSARLFHTTVTTKAMACPHFTYDGQRISALNSSDIAVWKNAVSLRGKRCPAERCFFSDAEISQSVVCPRKGQLI